MALVKCLKMPAANKKFNANQRVWVRYMTGDAACCVVGKFRGKGRYIEAWVRWDSKDAQMPKFEEFDVSDDFANRHNLLAISDLGAKPTLTNT
jgi:hypothetical protein